MRRRRPHGTQALLEHVLIERFAGEGLDRRDSEQRVVRLVLAVQREEDLLVGGEVSSDRQELTAHTRLPLEELDVEAGAQHG